MPPELTRRRAAARRLAALAGVIYVVAGIYAGAHSTGQADARINSRDYVMHSAQQTPALPTPLPPPSNLPQPTYPPSPQASPAESAVPTVPEPMTVVPASLLVLLGHTASAHVISPASGVVAATGFDANIVKASFNPIERSIEVTGLHAGSTTITLTNQFNLTTTLAVTVQVSAGKAFDSTSVVITGHPATADFVAEIAAKAAAQVAYPQPGARVRVDPALVADAHMLEPDNVAVVRAPVDILGEGYAPYHQEVRVQVSNLAQPRVAPKSLLVSDFPETLTQNGTLFYADVTYDKPARLLYYHYSPPGSALRRILVKVQNKGNEVTLLELIAGLAGPSHDILSVGHESTKRFLVREAGGEGEVFEVLPQTTINVVSQLLLPSDLVSGLMQVRVISGSDVRIALVAQDAGDPPTDPISDTLLQSAETHARGIYQVPEFFYDEYYTVGDEPTTLLIGKLPLPNLVQGQVLGGDYGVKQSADLTLVNPTAAAAAVGMWFEPRGGRATGTFLIDGQLVQLHPVDVGRPELIRSFMVSAKGALQVHVVSMPEGGSSYPVRVIFASRPPAGATWSTTKLVY